MNDRHSRQQQFNQDFAEALKTAGVSDSSGLTGSVALTGLTENEKIEYGELQIRHIGELTQEDWQRFNELNTKLIDSLLRQ